MALVQFADASHAANARAVRKEKGKKLDDVNNDITIIMTSSYLFDDVGTA